VGNRIRMKWSVSLFAGASEGETLSAQGMQARSFGVVVDMQETLRMHSLSTMEDLLDRKWI